MVVISGKISASKADFLAILDQRELLQVNMGRILVDYQLWYAKETLYSESWNLKMFLRKITLTRGIFLFQAFRLIEITEQIKASDAMTNQRMRVCLRNPPTGISSVWLEDLSDIIFLSTVDKMNDVSWLIAPIIVITNNEKYSGKYSRRMKKVEAQCWLEIVSISTQSK